MQIGKGIKEIPNVSCFILKGDESLNGKENAHKYLAAGKNVDTVNWKEEIKTWDVSTTTGKKQERLRIREIES